VEAASAPDVSGVDAAAIPPETEPPGGMINFCFTFKCFASTPGLAASSAFKLTPLFLAIFPRVSPETTTYSDPAPSAGAVSAGAGIAGWVTIGGGVFVSAGAVTTGTFVSIVADAFVSGWMAGGLVS